MCIIMKQITFKYLLFLLMTIALVSCGEEIGRTDLSNSSTRDSSFDSITHSYTKGNLDSNTTDLVEMAYNELANEDRLSLFPISIYNTDIESIKNIDRPKSSFINNTTIDTSLLFGIWVQDTNAPHALFQISSNYFYVVDYDGDGSMPYLLKNDSLTIYYNDFILGGKIVELDSTLLQINWSNSKTKSIYTHWNI